MLAGRRAFLTISRKYPMSQAHSMPGIKNLVVSDIRIEQEQMQEAGKRRQSTRRTPPIALLLADLAEKISHYFLAPPTPPFLIEYVILPEGSHVKHCAMHLLLKDLRLLF
jgi:hypothetical protein